MHAPIGSHPLHPVMCRWCTIGMLIHVPQQHHNNNHCDNQTTTKRQPNKQTTLMHVVNHAIYRCIVSLMLFIVLWFIMLIVRVLPLTLSCGLLVLFPGCAGWFMLCATTLRCLGQLLFGPRIRSVYHPQLLLRIGANHCKLRHIGWEKCGRGLTSRSKETAGVTFLDEFLVLLSVPSKVCSCAAGGHFALKVLCS